MVFVTPPPPKKTHPWRVDTPFASIVFFRSFLEKGFSILSSKHALRIIPVSSIVFSKNPVMWVFFFQFHAGGDRIRSLFLAMLFKWLFAKA